MQRLFFFTDTFMNISHLYDLYRTGRSISTDSRNISTGCLFFALKGENFNGNLFAREALEKGAVAAIVDEGPAEPDSRIISVDDVLATLQQLAHHHRIQSGIPVLAITGSNGKTTTKELCRAVLSAKFKVYATAGNLNNHIGVPLTLLAMDESIEFGIVEMGANHPGEISRLCAIAEPDYGLITNIGKAHIEGFGSLEGVAGAKGELFNHLMQNGKTLFVNEANPLIRQLVPDDYPKAVRYNGSRGTTISSRRSDPFLSLHAEYDGSSLEINTKLLGGYNDENVLAACCVGFHFGIAAKTVKTAIEGYQPQNSRSQLLDTGKNRIFLDAYNANPSSMLAAITEFLHMQGGNKMLILGEMRELGNSSEQEHESIINFLREQGIVDVVCVGKAFERSAARAGYRYAETTGQLIDWLSGKQLTSYFLLIKGSRSNQLEKLIPLL
jgi:UDP-N-acetylmuramoyl-tripeptide--D-alanyl-D-alanine ligase